MQLGAKETENERFSHYFTKTYRKTASLIANSLKAVSIESFRAKTQKTHQIPLQAATISGADAPLVETAFQYGKNLGLAFQFVDDLLDFVSSSETMGKPAAADLKLGLATAPVLFACEKVSSAICRPSLSHNLCAHRDDFRSLAKDKASRHPMLKFKIHVNLLLLHVTVALMMMENNRRKHFLV